MNTTNNVFTAGEFNGSLFNDDSIVRQAEKYLTSLDIAETTGKQHAHVMRDIRVLIEQGVDQSNFGLVEYTDKKGEKRPYYRLTPKGCLILASGYDALLREKIINRLEVYEKGRRPSYQEEDPIARAEAWIAEQKEKQALMLENKRMQPKADYFDNIVDRNLLTNFRDTAKQIGLKQNDFIKRLIRDKYIYRDKKNMIKPYSKFVGELFEIKDWGGDSKAGSQTLITPKGKETFKLLYSNALLFS